MRSTVTAIARIAAIAVLLWSSGAHADDARCIASFERTQQLRASGKLRSARAEALICSGRECPPIASRDCATWLLELDRMTPSVVFGAQANGAELLDVTVVVDGETVTRRLDGRAMPLDPGPHHLRFSSPGHVPAEQDVLVSEGETARKIVAQLAPTARPVEPPVATSRPVPPSVWVAGGIAALAAAGGVVFALDGFGKKHDLDASGCKPDCAPRDVDSMQRALLAADIFAGVGVVAAAAAVYFFVTRPARTSAAASAGRLPLVIQF